MDDLQRIIPDTVRKLGDRKLYLALSVVIVALVVVVVALAAVLGHTAGSGWSSAAAQSSGRCQTPTCLHTAAWIVENMDQTVDPCTDFYRYACGGWTARRGIPPDQAEVTMIGEMEEENDERLREIVEKGVPDQATGTTAETKLRDFYRSCVHDYGRQREGGKALLDVIRDAVKGWYVLDPSNWNANWDMSDAIARIRTEYQTFLFFKIGYGSNSEILNLRYSVDGLDSFMDYIDEDKIGVQEAYKDYMRSVSKLLLRDSNQTLSPTETNTRVEQFVSDVYGHEDKMARIVQRLDQQNRLNDNFLTTINQLQANFSQFDWLRIISNVFENASITATSVVRLWAPQYYIAINDLLRNESDAHIRDRVINNYIVWRLTVKYAPELSLDYRLAGQRYEEVVNGRVEWQPIWKTCLNTVADKLGTLLGSMFIKAHVGVTSNFKVTEMFETIRSTVSQRMTELPWMDDVTRTRAQAKVANIKSILGFSEMYYNETLIEEIHGALEIDISRSYFKNLLSLNKFHRRLKIKLLYIDRQDIFSHLPVFGYSDLHYLVQPYYWWYYNTILAPAGSMVDPMYNTKRQQVFNYGTLGAVFAGEMWEAVSKAGRFRYANGSHGDWWTNETNIAFKQQKECFVAYFDGLTAGPFEFDGTTHTVPVNGRTQTNQLLDDLGGIRAALKAYKRWTELNSVEDMPSGISANTDQLFFISTAQTQCYLRTDEEGYRYATDNYLPEDMVLNNILSHMPEFSSAFQCRAGAKMKADKQCQIF